MSRSWTFVVVALTALWAGCQGDQPAARPSQDAALETGADAASDPDAAGRDGRDGSPTDAGADADCTWDPSAGAVTAALTPNNAVVLVGPSLGNGVALAPELRRMVPVNVTKPVPGLEVGPAWLVSPGPLIDAAYLTIFVRNTGAAPYACFIGVDGYRWRNAAGTDLTDTLPSGAIGYVYGSVGKVGNSAYTDSCLGPGETGYLPDVRIATKNTKLFTEIASIELGFSHSYPATPAPEKVIARDYLPGSCAGKRSLRFRLENQSSDPVQIPSDVGGWAVFLDATDSPTGWHFLRSPGSALLAPGASWVTPAIILGNGAATHVYVYAKFGRPKLPALTSAPDPLLRRLLEQVATSRRRVRDDWYRATGLPFASDSIPSRD